jgi:2-polyprenyl-3-methyl-5-hydroxy-6-metoxy-1,4-benzoquinol methylase
MSDFQDWHLPVGNRILKTEAEIEQHLKKSHSWNLTASRQKTTIDLVNRPGKWLDVGCSSGKVTFQLAQKVDQVIGIDLDQTGIEIAQKWFKKPNIEYRLADLFASNFPAGDFDGMLFLEVIEHVENPLRFLQEFYRILKPGGVLIISTPNANSYSEILRRLFALSPGRTLGRLQRYQSSNDFDYRTNAGHIYAWTYETLHALLWRAGFMIDTLQPVGYYPISLRIAGREVRLFGKSEMLWLRPLIGTFCQTLLMRCYPRNK